MSHSLTRNLIHLVFTTKHREPVLTDALRPALHRYLAGVLRELDSPALVINSVADHVHILFDLHKTRALAQVVMEVKRGSSKWLKTQGEELAYFGWQNGYGAFSVGQSGADRVSAYIEQQAEHHRDELYPQELRRMVERQGIAWDERMLWD